MSGDRVRVCEEADIRPSEVEIVTVGQTTIGVFNLDGEYYAILNRCAHQRGPVCEGDIYQKVDAEFQGTGKRINEYYTDTPVIRCPWHGWEYEIKTGQNIGDNNVKLPTYDVVVEDGVIYVEV